MGMSSSYVRSVASSLLRVGLWVAMLLGFTQERAKHTVVKSKGETKEFSKENFYSWLSKSIKKFLELMLQLTESKSGSLKGTLGQNS